MATTTMLLLIAQYLTNFVISIFTLWATLKILNIRNRGLKHISIISLMNVSIITIPGLYGYITRNKEIIQLAGLFCLIGFIVSLALIYRLCESKWKKTLLATITYFLIFFVIMAIAGIVWGSIQSNSSILKMIRFASVSMTHRDNEWTTWLMEHGISESRISNFPFQGGINQNDFVTIKSPENIMLGDVILYERDKRHPYGNNILHRVVGIVKVKDWKINSIDGTLDCLSENDFVNTYVPYVKNCVNKVDECPYNKFPETGTFKFYITKGDNPKTNRVTDQCPPGVGIALPVTDVQVIGKAA